MNEVRIKNGKQELTEDQEDLVEQNINDLLNLGIYSLPTLRISAKADEESVADIFVRVNSGGQNLTEKISLRLCLLFMITAYMKRLANSVRTPEFQQMERRIIVFSKLTRHI